MHLGGSFFGLGFGCYSRLRVGKLERSHISKERDWPVVGGCCNATGRGECLSGEIISESVVGEGEMIRVWFPIVVGMVLGWMALFAVIFRYQIEPSGAIVYRLDRWTGRVVAISAHAIIEREP